MPAGHVSTENAVFRVLIADDVQDLRSMLRLALELSGRFTVVAEAMNGAHAVDLAAMYKPDLALLDLSMPTLDGLEALPRILEVSPETKVVVLSGFEEARMAYLARCGMIESYDRDKIGVILHSTSCRFRAPVFHPDTIDVGVRVSEVGQDRFTMEYVARSTTHDTLVAEGIAIVVCFDYARQQKAALPVSVRGRIHEIEKS